MQEVYYKMSDKIKKWKLKNSDVEQNQEMYYKNVEQNQEVHVEQNQEDVSNKMRFPDFSGESSQKIISEFP